MAENTEQKEHDVLDDIKLAEKQMKMAMLMNNIKTLKEIAKDVLIGKEKMLAYLEEMGMNEAEQKRVIDFINSLVVLTKRDKEDIREEVRNESDKQKEKIEKKIEDDPMALISKHFVGYAQNAGAGGFGGNINAIGYPQQLYTAADNKSYSVGVSANGNTTLNAINSLGTQVSLKL